MADDPDAEVQTRAALRWVQHELHTQLGQILGYAEMLTEDLDDAEHEDERADAERVISSARRVSRIVDEFLSSATSAVPTGPLPDRRLDQSLLRPVGAAGRILIVDDDPTNRELLARRLTRRGHSAAEADSGAAALRAIESDHFDLVLLDMLMPAMDGLQTLDAIRQMHSMSELPVIMVTARTSGDDVVSALQHLANDYVTKPVDLEVLTARVETQVALRSSALEIETLARKLEIRNSFLRRTFGRFMSDDVADELLDQDEGLLFGLQRRRVTVLMADVRGFTALTERLDPHDCASILNRYVETMADVVHAHHGSIDNIMGDGILALFGAFEARDDDALRSIMCAEAMQHALDAVNDEHRAHGLASIAMGVGIATGEVLVGNIGSERRSKHTAIGSAVNLAARIESFTGGGEIMIAPATFEDVENDVTVVEVREIRPKGFDGDVVVRRVTVGRSRVDDAASSTPVN